MRGTFDGNYVSLIREMAKASRDLEDLPVGTEYTQDMQDMLEDLRHAGLQIVREVEAIFAEIQKGEKR